MKGKPRGTTSGLKGYQAGAKERNTKAMLGVIEVLKIERSTSRWSYKDVWSAAGLKSQVALDSPWNADVKSAIDLHNQLLASSAHIHFSGTDGAIDKLALRDLRRQVSEMKEQRDQALARIAQYCADTDYYKKRCQDFQRTVERLKSTITSSGIERLRGPAP